jgi:hypothetical protein
MKHYISGHCLLFLFSAVILLTPITDSHLQAKRSRHREEHNSYITPQDHKIKNLLFLSGSVLVMAFLCVCFDVPVTTYINACSYNSQFGVYGPFSYNQRPRGPETVIIIK